MRAACENTFVRKDTTANLVDDTVNNISSASEPTPFRERTTAQTSFKRKKKYSNNEGTDETSDIKCKKRRKFTYKKLKYFLLISLTII